LATDHDGRWRFPSRQPVSPRSATGTLVYETNALRAYLGNDAGLAPYLAVHFGTRLEQPFAHLMRRYQNYIYPPGLVFRALCAVGLAGILVKRRRSAAAVLLWVSAVVLIVLPVAEHQFNYRYALAAVPLVCMAAALVLTGRGGQPPAPAGTAPAGTAPAGT